VAEQRDQRLRHRYPTTDLHHLASAADTHVSIQLAHYPVIRRAQEMPLARPIDRGVAILDGTYRGTLPLKPYATACLWITPASDR